MAQIPNLENAPVNLTLLRCSRRRLRSDSSCVKVEAFFSHVWSILFIFLVCVRDRSQKELISILRNVGFAEIFLWNTSFVTFSIVCLGKLERRGKTRELIHIFLHSYAVLGLEWLKFEYTEISLQFFLLQLLCWSLWFCWRCGFFCNSSWMVSRYSFCTY